MIAMKPTILYRLREDMRDNARIFMCYLVVGERKPRLHQRLWSLLIRQPIVREKWAMVCGSDTDMESGDYWFYTKVVPTEPTYFYFEEWHMRQYDMMTEVLRRMEHQL